MEQGDSGIADSPEHNSRTNGRASAAGLCVLHSSQEAHGDRRTPVHRHYWNANTADIVVSVELSREYAAAAHAYRLRNDLM